MDQAMGDLQNQLEEVKRMWEEERNARQRFELELESLRNNLANGNSTVAPHPQQQSVKSPDGAIAESTAGTKRKSEEAPEHNPEGDNDRDGKRQRTE